jgi:hypothetical protein
MDLEMDTQGAVDREGVTSVIEDPELGLPVGENSRRVHAEEAAVASPKPAKGLGRRKGKGKEKGSGAEAKKSTGSSKSKNDARKEALRQDIDFVSCRSLQEVCASSMQGLTALGQA